LIGVLGGMGPAATVDFYGKLIAATPAQSDQEHLPVLIHGVPQIPDRSAAFLHGGPSPRPLLVAFAQRLEAAGAQVIVMPCNTAHLWHDDVAASVSVPVLHIVDAVVAAIAQRAASGAPLPVGLLATTATLQGELYPRRSGAIGARHLHWIAPTAEQQQQWVAAGISAVKAGRMGAGRRLLALAARALVARGARAIVLACTEVPLVLGAATDGVPNLDATQLLAEATAEWVLGVARRDSVLSAARPKAA
jgi:aspartate racemase